MLRTWSPGKVTKFTKTCLHKGENQEERWIGGKHKFCNKCASNRSEWAPVPPFLLVLANEKLTPRALAKLLIVHKHISFEQSYDNRVEISLSFTQCWIDWYQCWHILLAQYLFFEKGVWHGFSMGVFDMNYFN